MSAIPRQLLLQVILILINAFFAATEIAVVSTNATKLRKMAEEGDRKAGKLLKLVEQPSSFLSTIQVGITLAGFLGSAFAADSFAGYLVDWVYKDLGYTRLSPDALRVAAVVVITLILSYFTLIFGELVPKRIAMQKSMEVAKFSCGVISVLAVIMRPVVWFLSKSTNLMLRVLHLKTEAEEQSVTEEEIRMMVDLGGEKGTIDQDEQEWIQNVFRFNDISVRDAMTREADVVAFSLDEEDADIINTIRESGLSRYPVYDEDINDVVGILSARDYLLDRRREHPEGLRSLLREPYFVPDTIHADDLFRDMQKGKVHIAIVIDEYGQTAGVITMEDLLEEIVGNIYDEFDPAEQPEIVPLGENLWRISGGAYIEDIAEALDIELPEDTDYDTLGGMIFSCLRTIPADGSQFDVQVNGLDIHVEKLEDQRVETALVKKLPAPEPEKDEEEGQEGRNMFGIDRDRLRHGKKEEQGK
ncbi:MAG: hemolysin family protein [Eubacteriales bacterium]|nr:hemolysin family protein [Eubacteriales bacterium]